MTADPFSDFPLDDEEPIGPAPEPEPSSEPEPERRTRAKRSHKRKTPAADSQLEAKLREPLLRIGEWVDGRDPEFGQAIREDAPKMAKLLAKWAASSKAPPLYVAVVGLVASALEPIDAFARVVRLTLFRAFDARARRRAAAAAAGAQEIDHAGDPFVPEPVYADTPPADEGDTFVTDRGTPERFQAGSEPPHTD